MPERGPGARFAAFVQGPDHEIALDEGALLIAAHAHPSVDIPTRLADLDELAGSVDDATRPLSRERCSYPTCVRRRTG